MEMHNAIHAIPGRVRNLALGQIENLPAGSRSLRFGIRGCRPSPSVGTKEWWPEISPLRVIHVGTVSQAFKVLQHALKSQRFSVYATF